MYQVNLLRKNIIIYYLLAKRNKNIDGFPNNIDFLLNKWLVPIIFYLLLLNFVPNKMVTSSKCEIISFGWNALKNNPSQVSVK